MKSKLTFVNTGLLLLVAMVTTVNAKAFTTYTAITNGNFTADSVWSGGVAPSTNITSDDHIVIPNTVSVTLDHDLILNHANASLEVYGTLTGAAAFNAMQGMILGTGNLTLGNINISASGGPYFTGTITAHNMSICRSLTLFAPTYVIDTLTLTAGTVTIDSFSTLILGSHATVKIGDGDYTLRGGQVVATDDINIMYIAAGAHTMGTELTLPSIRNIMVSLPTDTDQISLADDMTLPGGIYILTGILDLNGKDIAMQEIRTRTFAGSIKGYATSSMSIYGNGINSIAFAPGYLILDRLNVNVSDTTKVALNSDLTLNNGLNLNSGILFVAGNNLTINGRIMGNGSFITQESTHLAINGTGYVGLLRWVADSVSLGDLDLNITGVGGRVALGSAVRISGVLTMTAGDLDLNGHNLTMSGIFAPMNTGALMGNINSNVTISGEGGDMGIMAFAAGYDTINNLTFNSTEMNSWVTLGTDLNVAGKLSLYGGYMDLDSSFALRVHGADSVSGGSDASYIATSGTAMVWMKMNNQASDNARTIPVGTRTRYAPIRISNLGQAAANYGAIAHAGIWSAGTSGTDISATSSSINTSWNVESDAATGNNVTIEAYWNQSMEVNQFNNHNTYISHYTNGAWDTYAGAQSVAQANGFSSVLRTGITSFSPFAVFSNPDTIAGPNGVKDLVSDVVSIYPNPAINNITVTVTDPAIYHDVKVFDITGQQVASYPLTRTRNSIDISPLQSGVYIVSVNDKFTQRLIKQ
ncbi:MAG: hypothetical protein JWO03_79 [Bacteroidetes bacterium]|nr:hypothetical protein [Bacteroidota bacterium]